MNATGWKNIYPDMLDLGVIAGCVPGLFFRDAYY
jgi:hypothetical protein